jgi:transketolase
MSADPAARDDAQLVALRDRARALRRNVVRMAAGKGEGYVGQGLQAADVLAALFFHELRWAPPEADDPEADRFVLSTGHYSIALWAVFAELGALSEAEIDTYGADGSAVAMSTERGLQRGVELTGGSLGHGLGVAAGMAAGRRLKGESGRVVNYMSDGELQEGSTWEAAMWAGDQALGNLICVVDVNRTQADGPLVVEVEPVPDKFAAFGWWAREVDGHDVEALVAVLEAARAQTEQPKAIVCHTQLGAGVPLIIEREKAHFVRVDQEEWARVAQEVEAS